MKKERDFEDIKYVCPFYENDVHNDKVCTIKLIDVDTEDGVTDIEYDLCSKQSCRAIQLFKAFGLL